MANDSTGCGESICVVQTRPLLRIRKLSSSTATVPAVELAALLAAPRRANRQSVRARAEFRAPGAAPDDAILAAPLRVERLPNFGVSRDEIGKGS